MASSTPAEVWSAGDYADVCDLMIPQLGARLVELAGVSAGEKVLDVACGTGNASLPAAVTGAVVTALDITQELLQGAARRADAAGLEVVWVHGDAQAMPFADASFEKVLSCVGVQFCGDQQAAVRELIRVCRPGGRIALVAWTPEGFIGQVLAAVGRATGAAAKGASPLAWGREQTVREWFGELCHGGVGVATVREHVTMRADSPAAWVDYMAGAYGPMVRARVSLEQAGGWAALREELSEIAGAHNLQAVGDAFAAPAEYLVAVIDR